MLSRLALGNDLWKTVIRPRLFELDGEAAHKKTIRMLVWMQRLRLLWVLKLLFRSPLYRDHPVNVGGVPWRNPVGIAAGFDKHGEAVRALDALGVGVIELGTAPPEPQPGNEQPRVFRYEGCRAIINRYGFNSHGARRVARRLRRLHRWHHIGAAIGVSIGKNKATPDEEAVADYLMAFRIFLPVLRPGKDYIKINISSPNTPGLRKIFDRLGPFLREFMTGAREIADELGYPMPPVYLKVPPDGLSPTEYQSIARIAGKAGIAAIEAVNTTVSEELKRKHGLSEVGGLSGRPLTGLALQCLYNLNGRCRKAGVDLVGVGGIMNGYDALQRRNAGAKAVQVYTGLVFEGPLLMHDILEQWGQK